MYGDSRRPQEVKSYTKGILAPLMYEAYSSTQSNWPDWSGLPEGVKKFWLLKAEKALMFLALPGTKNIANSEKHVAILAYVLWEKDDGIDAWMAVARLVLAKLKGA